MLSFGSLQRIIRSCCELCSYLWKDAGRRACRIFLDRCHPAASLPHFDVVTVAQSARPGRCGRIVRTFMFAQRQEFTRWLHNTESIETHAALRYLEPGSADTVLLLVPQMSLKRQQRLATR